MNLNKDGKLSAQQAKKLTKKFVKEHGQAFIEATTGMTIPELIEQTCAELQVEMSAAAEPRRIAVLRADREQPVQDEAAANAAPDKEQSTEGTPDTVQARVVHRLGRHANILKTSDGVFFERSDEQDRHRLEESLWKAMDQLEQGVSPENFARVCEMQGLEWALANDREDRLLRKIGSILLEARQFNLWMLIFRTAREGCAFEPGDEMDFMTDKPLRSSVERTLKTDVGDSSREPDPSV